MAVSDSLALSSPYIAPPVDPKQERLRERRADLRPCPECGTEAEFEPPIMVHRRQVPGEQRLYSGPLTVIRCPSCKVLTRSEEIPAPITREEPTPMSLCECGCGEAPKVGRRFASCACSNRFNAAKRREQKSSPSPEAISAIGHEPQGSRPGPLGEGTPPVADPGSPRAQALAYLLSLSPEQREAFGALLEAEERCQQLGVA